MNLYQNVQFSGFGIDFFGSEIFDIQVFFNEDVWDIDAMFCSRMSVFFVNYIRFRDVTEVINKFLQIYFQYIFFYDFCFYMVKVRRIRFVVDFKMMVFFDFWGYRLFFFVQFMLERKCGI